MKDFKELKVWQKAHALTLSIYACTRLFPRDEIYGLTSQIRRSAASIGANIAEGCGRRSDGELARFLQIARGSASETEYHLLLARDLKFISEVDYRDAVQRVIEVEKMLTSLVQTVQPQRNIKSNQAAERKAELTARS